MAGASISVSARERQLIHLYILGKYGVNYNFFLVVGGALDVVVGVKGRNKSFKESEYVTVNKHLI